MLQPHPKRLKVGNILYSCESYTHDLKPQADLDTWCVRSIQYQRNSQSAYGIPIPSHLSNKTKLVRLVRLLEGQTIVNGTYASSIISAHRKSFPAGRSLPLGIFTTKLKAIDYQISVTKSYLKELDPFNEDDDLELSETKAELVKLKNLRLRTKKSRGS